jgi:hypothetical protein
MGEYKVTLSDGTIVEAPEKDAAVEMAKELHNSFRGASLNIDTSSLSSANPDSCGIDHGSWDFSTGHDGGK